MELPFINNAASFSSFRVRTQTRYCACAVSLDTGNHASHWLSLGKPAHAAMPFARIFTSRDLPGSYWLRFTSLSNGRRALFVDIRRPHKFLSRFFRVLNGEFSNYFWVLIYSVKTLPC